MTVTSTNKPRGNVPLAPRFFKKSLIIFISLLLLFLIVTFPLFPHFIILKGNSNQIIYKSSISKTDKFQINYIHSIHLTPVDEFYRIGKDLKIYLYELQFDTYSVGMPSELNEGETLEIKNGKFIIKNMNRSFSHFDLRIGQVRANHKLIINGETIELGKIAKPGSMVRFEAKKLNILELLGVNVF